MGSKRYLSDDFHKFSMLIRWFVCNLGHKHHIQRPIGRASLLFLAFSGLLSLKFHLFLLDRPGIDLAFGFFLSTFHLIWLVVFAFSSFIQRIVCVMGLFLLSFFCFRRYFGSCFFFSGWCLCDCFWYLGDLSSVFGVVVDYFGAVVYFWSSHLLFGSRGSFFWSFFSISRMWFVLLIMDLRLKTAIVHGASGPSLPSAAQLLAYGLRPLRCVVVRLIKIHSLRELRSLRSCILINRTHSLAFGSCLYS